MKTYSVKAGEISRQWHVIDAAGRPLGRVAVEVAYLLRGKHKPIFTPHLDVGDYVIVINAAKVYLTGRKSEQKTYYRHSGYPGGFRATQFKDAIKARPTWVFEHAVEGMLPRNALGRAMLGKLRVYAGAIHPHQAQVAASSKPKED